MEVNSIFETKNADFFENIFSWKTNGEQQVQRNLSVESSDPSKLNREEVKEKEKKLILVMTFTLS